MITMKDLSLSSRVYQVSIDSIESIGIESLIWKSAALIDMKIEGYNYHTITVHESLTFFEIGKVSFYLNFEEAQKRQLELRQNTIDRLLNEMNASIATYKEAVQKYSNKPPTTIEEL